MTYSSLLPLRRLLKAMRRPSGDHADWASSARTSVSWVWGRPNDGIAKMSPLSAVPKRFELNDSQPFSPGQEACTAGAGATAAAMARTAMERNERANMPGGKRPPRAGSAVLRGRPRHLAAVERREPRLGLVLPRRVAL